jgi:molybdenum cofactor cytidylyltransferase
MSKLNKVGIIILAAGSSSRLGQPKQLLSYQHKSLLGHTIESAKNIKDGKVLIILGDKHGAIATDIAPLKVDVLYNSEWEEGMSSSIRAGLGALLTGQALNEAKYDATGYPATAAKDIDLNAESTLAASCDLEGVILTVCDQPFLTSAVLQALLDKAKHSGRSIVASAYKDTLGTPVYFGKQHFRDLLALKGAEGARMLLKKYDAELASVPFDKGEIDIDTKEDYQKLISQNIQNDKRLL